MASVMRESNGGLGALPPPPVGTKGKHKTASTLSEIISNKVCGIWLCIWPADRPTDLFKKREL